MKRAFFRKRKLLLLKALSLFVALQFSTLFCTLAIFWGGGGCIFQRVPNGGGEIFFPSLSISQTCSSSSSECFFLTSKKELDGLQQVAEGGSITEMQKRTLFRFF